ncbi:MAG: N-6 DNA methylase [Candidatus Levybacteria bacterium]|nr:N-6 DNA methylase [Candidatus Levybacteria bacterium]
MFIDTRKMGTMTDRRQRELTEEELNQIVDTYHNWE